MSNILDEKVIDSIMTLGEIKGSILEDYFNANGDLHGYKNYRTTKENEQVWISVIESKPEYQKIFKQIPESVPFMTRIWMVGDFAENGIDVDRLFEMPKPGYEYTDVLNATITGAYLRNFGFSRTLPTEMFKENKDIWEGVLPEFPDIKVKFDALPDDMPFIVRLRAAILWSEYKTSKM